MVYSLAIHWFRQDLRLSDNPGLSAASQSGHVLPVYILDDHNAAAHKMGAASRWWLHHSLTDLNTSLGGNLRVYKGDATSIIIGLAEEYNIQEIYWNRCYEPWRTQRDAQIKKTLASKNINVHSYNSSMLWEPWNVLKNDGTPYKVFTPFYRKGCQNAQPPRKPVSAPQNLNLAEGNFGNCSIEELGLLPQIRWDIQLEQHWEIGEIGAQKRLNDFITTGLHGYKNGRDRPAQNNVSRLSPHLHFGEISPNQAYYAALSQGENNDTDTFLRELGWREFSYNLLYHNPDLPRKNLQRKFNNFPWLDNKSTLERWKRGMTGIPIVDAGMRQLWQTGYMHNRVRMIVGSFLVKNLLLHWSNGERWFWDCLVDADLSNNSASWQWIAGCGADAAPYFRIFNPVTQGQKFDPDGTYTRHFVPELKDLPDKYLFNPWEAPNSLLNQANVTLGKTYPEPIVDLKTSRQRALDAFQSLKP